MEASAVGDGMIAHGMELEGARVVTGVIQQQLNWCYMLHSYFA